MKIKVSLTNPNYADDIRSTFVREDELREPIQRVSWYLALETLIRRYEQATFNDEGVNFILITSGTHDATAIEKLQSLFPGLLKIEAVEPRPIYCGDILTANPDNGDKRATLANIESMSFEDDFEFDSLDNNAIVSEVWELDDAYIAVTYQTFDEENESNFNYKFIDPIDPPLSEQEE